RGRTVRSSSISVAAQGGVSARAASDHGQSHAGGLSRGKAAGGRASTPAGRTRRERSARRARGTPASGGKTEGAGIRGNVGDDLEGHAQEKRDHREGGCDGRVRPEECRWRFCVRRRSL